MRNRFARERVNLDGQQDGQDFEVEAGGAQRLRSVTAGLPDSLPLSGIG